MKPQELRDFTCLVIYLEILSNDTCVKVCAILREFSNITCSVNPSLHSHSSVYKPCLIHLK